jgi:hypothetical protein
MKLSIPGESKKRPEGIQEIKSCSRPEKCTEPTAGADLGPPRGDRPLSFPVGSIFRFERVVILWNLGICEERGAGGRPEAMESRPPNVKRREGRAV